MNIHEFQNVSTRTLSKDFDDGKQIINMCMGLAGETGEVIDIFKKYFYQGHDLDLKKVEEEIGDVMFYLVNLCTLLDIDMRLVLTRNYLKLKARYPNGFEIEKSINRQEV